MARRTNAWKTKREAGSGSYRRRGNGSWQLTVRDVDGNRLTKTVKATNETEVKRMLRDFVASVRREEVPKAKGRPTVAQVADMWLEHKLKINRDLAEATVASIEWAMGHIKRRWGRRKVSMITEGHQVEELFADLLDDGLGPKAIREVSSILHQVLKYAHGRKYVHVDATRFVEVRPRVQQKPVSAPSDADVAAFVKAMFAYKHEHGVHLVLSTALGCRRAEALGIRLVDVDFEHGEIHLRRNVVKIRRKSAAGKGESRVVVKDVMKTQAGRRVVTVPPGVTSLVAQWVAEIDEHARDFGLAGFPHEGLIFSTAVDGSAPYNPDSINARFRRVARIFGVTPVAPHQLRHYAATILAPHMTPTELMGRFGWRTQDMVQRYADYRRTVDSEAARLIGESAALADVVPIAKRESA
jgi:integrase